MKTYKMKNETSESGNMRIKRVKLRPHKMDRLGKGYYPIHRTLDKYGRTLTYIVRLPRHKIEFNTLLEARKMAIKI